MHYVFCIFFTILVNYVQKGELHFNKGQYFFVTVGTKFTLCFYVFYLKAANMSGTVVELLNNP